MSLMRKICTIGAIVIILSLMLYCYKNREIYKYFMLEKRTRASDVNYVKQFINQGGDPNHVFREHLNSADSLLEIATKKSDLPMVEMLVSNGADPNHFYSQHYDSPYLNAITVSDKTENSYNILRKFTENFTILKPNCVGDTPVHYAYTYGDSKVINILGQHPEFILALGIKNRLGQTPLDIQNSEQNNRPSNR
jgi:ankyrin repeat protein